MLCLPLSFFQNTESTLEIDMATKSLAFRKLHTNKQK